MVESVYQLLSYFGVAQLTAEASMTDVVVVFLVSKPVFVAAAAVAAGWAYFRRHPREVSEMAGADSLLPD